MQDLPLFNVSQNINKPILDTLTAQVQPKEEPKTIQHTVVEGESLSKIAKQYNTTWQRLWSKNTHLNNQDMLVVGDKLAIPHADEVIADRPLYTLPVQQNSPQPIKSSPQGDSSGNMYEPGQCVWYVKNRRPDLPNNLGNATSWLYNAQAQGLATGTEPRAGAVGWTSGHVVYIESVNADGSVNYTDMNGNWVAFELGSGTQPANYYKYIY